MLIPSHTPCRLPAHHFSADVHAWNFEFINKEKLYYEMNFSAVFAKSNNGNAFAGVDTTWSCYVMQGLDTVCHLKSTQHFERIDSILFFRDIEVTRIVRASYNSLQTAFANWSIRYDGLRSLPALNESNFHIAFSKLTELFYQHTSEKTQAVN